MSDDAIAQRARTAERVRRALDSMPGLRWKSLELAGQGSALEAAVTLDARSDVAAAGTLIAQLRRQVPELAGVQVRTEASPTRRWRR